MGVHTQLDYLWVVFITTTTSIVASLEEVFGIVKAAHEAIGHGGGKKTIAEDIVYGAFDIIQAKTNEDPLAIFEKAIRNASPVVEVKARRIGGSTYQVPV